MTPRYVKRAGQPPGTRAVPGRACGCITGFEQRPIAVRKGSRARSSYTTRKRLSVFANAITSFSNRPLVYIFQIGMAVMALSVVAAALLLYMSLNGRIGVPGWASIMVSIWFLGGLIIFCVGVIGMYLAKIFTEIKQRPYTIVRARIRAPGASTRTHAVEPRRAFPARAGARLLRDEAARARPHAGRRRLEFAGVAGAAVRAARQSLAATSRTPACSTTAAATARWPTYLRAPRPPRTLHRLRRQRRDDAGRAHARCRVAERCASVTTRREDLAAGRLTPSPAASSTSSRTPTNEAWRAYMLGDHRRSRRAGHAAASRSMR